MTHDPLVGPSRPALNLYLTGLCQESLKREDMPSVHFASIVPDIATRAIDHAFDYLVPERLERSCTVGATVLVTFSHRDVVGYVIDLKDEPSQGLAPERVLPVRRVLA